MNNYKIKFFYISLIIFIFYSLVYSAQIKIQPEIPVKNKQAIITIQLDKNETFSGFKIIYRPNSKVSNEKNFILNKNNQIIFVPEDAGLVNLILNYKKDGKEKSITKTISVKYDKIPVSGIIIFIMAGLILFSGIGISLKIFFSMNKEI